MSASPSPRADAAAPGATLAGLWFAALATTLVGNLLVRVAYRSGTIPSAGRLALAGLSAVPLAVAAIFFWRLLRRDLDEMLQRIVLEGLAFAFVVYVPVIALWTNLRAAGATLPRLDAPEIVLAPAWLAGIGILLARRRYR